MRYVCIALLLASAGVAQQASPEAINFHRKQSEAALFEKLADDYRKHSMTIESTAAAQYLDALGKRLALHLGDALSYSFTLVANDPNALHEPVSLPGGQIFVPAKLFITVQNEAEFAGMLAHAMAHVAERHMVRTSLNGPNGPVHSWVMGPFGDDTAVLPVAFIKLKSGFELEADRDAVKAMAAAGFDPRELAAYLSRIPTPDTGGKSAFARYPSRAERLAALDSAIEQVQAPSYAGSPDFATVRDTVRPLMPESRRPVPSLVKNTPQQLR